MFGYLIKKFCFAPLQRVDVCDIIVRLDMSGPLPSQHERSRFKTFLKQYLGNIIKFQEELRNEQGIARRDDQGLSP